MSETPLLFAQLTDLHVGGAGLNITEADHNLRWALGELEQLTPAPHCAVLTADLVCGGKRAELERFRQIVAEVRLPWYALPANHDLWGEQDATAWEEVIGPRRQSVDLPGLRIVLWDEMRRTPEGGWVARADHESLAWLDRQLGEAAGACVTALHTPILPLGDSFHDRWEGSNAAEVLGVLRERGVLAVLSGHWHRNGEWDAAGVRVINTGALCGWQWTGTPPHYCFPVRPGYRLLHYDGRLRSFWREGSYFRMPAPVCQVTLQWVGGAHTGGPRPQVHPCQVSAPCRLVAQAFALGEPVELVEYSLVHRNWQPMQCTFDGPWSDWEATVDPTTLRQAGELVCCIRATTASGHQACDEVPLSFGQRDCAAATPAPAYQLAGQLFELFYCPE